MSSKFSDHISAGPLGEFEVARSSHLVDILVRIPMVLPTYSVVLTTGFTLAYRFGVITGIIAPRTKGFLAASLTVWPKELLYSGITAVHVSIDASNPSVSNQISAALQNLLQGGKSELAAQFRRTSKGKLSLLIELYSADTIASLINLKIQERNRK